MLLGVENASQVRGQRGPLARRALDGVGEFGGMRGRERDHGGAPIALQRRARGRDADRRMRIDRDAALPMHARDFADAFRLGDSNGVEIAPDRRQRRRANREFAGLLETAHQRSQRPRIAAMGLEQQPLEI